MTSEKKRKRKPPAAPVNPNPIEITHAPSTSFPPIIASTHGVAIPPLPFTAYFSAEAPSSSLKKTKRSRVEYHIHGSNSRLEYAGCEAPEEIDSVRHYVGIYDPGTHSLELHLAPKLHITASIKARNESDKKLATMGAGVKQDYNESKGMLGIAFGTRKAQNALMSREMNKVDATKINATLGAAIVSQVSENTKDIPTAEMLNKSMQDERPIPKYNAQASSPSEVYKREDIISSEEWESIFTSDWQKLGEVKTKSSYVRIRATRMIADDPRKFAAKLKMLKYLGWMIEFFVEAARSRGRLPPLARARQIVGTAPPIVHEALYKRFADATGDPNARPGRDGQPEERLRYTVSPTMELKLQYYIAVLCLIIDDYDVDIFDLKQDMNLQPRELSNAFKEVGSTVREMSKTQYTAAKMTKAEASQHRKAILKVPLEFPVARKRPGQKRR